MISRFRIYTHNLICYFNNKISSIFYGKIKKVNLNELFFEEDIMYEEDIFDMPELKDVFGNNHQIFSGYHAKIPSLKVRQLNNSYCITNREEIYTSQKNVISEFTSQNKNPMVGKSKIYFTKFKVLNINANVAHLSMSGLENNYYHFLTECLSRYFLIEKSKFKPDFYVISNHLNFQQEYLKLLGINENRIISTNQNLLIYAKKLIVPDFINNWDKIYYRGYLSYQKIWVPSWLSKCYNDTLLGNLPKPSRNKFIYISRQKALYRKFVNQVEVENLLKELGFETYFLEEMTVVDQIKLFSSASIVFGIHGAGLANLYFAGKQVKFFELYPEFYHDSSFRILAISLNLEYSFMIAESNTMNNVIPQKENVYVEVENLRIALTNFLN
jgi:hypothetical protein